MKLNGYRCDNCSKVQQCNFLSFEGVPFGWFTVKLSMFIMPPTFTFCSKSCLYQWSSNQLTEESKKMEENEKATASSQSHT